MACKPPLYKKMSEIRTNFLATSHKTDSVLAFTTDRGSVDRISLDRIS